MKNNDNDEDEKKEEEDLDCDNDFKNNKEFESRSVSVFPSSFSSSSSPLLLHHHHFFFSPSIDKRFLLVSCYTITFSSTWAFLFL